MELEKMKLDLVVKLPRGAGNLSYDELVREGVIRPGSCIDCGAGVEVRRVRAIYPDGKEKKGKLRTACHCGIEIFRADGENYPVSPTFGRSFRER